MAKRGSDEWRANITAGKLKHGDATHSARAPEYRIWSLVVQRCTNPNNPAYPAYGGRGITVCQRWLSYENFIADMGRRPSAKHSLDRRDNEKGYSLENCRWVLWVNQMNNHRRTAKFTINGVEKTLQELSNESGLSRRLIARRLRSGWDPRRALSEVPRQS